MHSEAFEFVKQHATDKAVKVVEFGSFNVNGSVRGLFPKAEYVGVDVREGNGVDVVADAATWKPDALVDVVVCTEVLEHAAEWKKIVANCGKILRPGGVLVLTCAGPGRLPHSNNGSPHVPDSEYYANIEPAALKKAVAWGEAEVTVAGTDLQLVARKAGK